MSVHDASRMTYWWCGFFAGGMAGTLFGMLAQAWWGSA